MLLCGVVDDGVLLVGGGGIDGIGPCLDEDGAPVTAAIVEDKEPSGVEPEGG